MPATESQPGWRLCSGFTLSLVEENRASTRQLLQGHSEPSEQGSSGSPLREEQHFHPKQGTTGAPGCPRFSTATRPSPLKRHGVEPARRFPKCARALLTSPLPPAENSCRRRRAAAARQRWWGLHRDYNVCTTGQRAGEPGPAVQKCFVSRAPPKGRNQLSKPTACERRAYPLPERTPECRHRLQI